MRARHAVIGMSAGSNKSPGCDTHDMVLEYATPDERRAFLDHIPPPIRPAYRVTGRRKHAREIAVVRGRLA